MTITRNHRRGAASVLALALAGFLPAQLQGEVASAQIQAVPAVQETTATPAVLEPVIDEAKDFGTKILDQSPEPIKTLEKSTVIGEGVASFYGAELAGNRTASGERFNPSALTAAHRTLPLGSKVKVTNKANGKSVVVRINDRGPFSKGRIIDVSRGAAEKIAMVRSGTARVAIERID